MEVGYGRLQALTANEPHCVIGASILVMTQTIDRDDPRVLEPTSDLGLEQEP